MCQHTVPLFCTLFQRALVAGKVHYTHCLHEPVQAVQAHRRYGVYPGKHIHTFLMLLHCFLDKNSYLLFSVHLLRKPEKKYRTARTLLL